MSVIFKKNSLPVNTIQCTGIVCNGEMEDSRSLWERMKGCQVIIGVDGGINHCHALGLSPSWLIGDFDSVDQIILKEMAPGKKSLQLKREKDETDLEIALFKALEISQGPIIIFGGLGGRLDHTLTNVLITSRFPGRVFLESEHQLIFAANSTQGTLYFSHPEYQTLALYPLNGLAKDIHIKNELQDFHYEILNKNQLILSFSNWCSLTIGIGEVIVCLDKRKLSSFTSLPEKGECQVDFSLKFPLTHAFDCLFHLSSFYKTLRFVSEKEAVSAIHPGSKTTLAVSRGQVISLIPLYGRASGIKTEGLNWELNNSAIDKNFVGISNFSLREEVSMNLSEGELLCIVNQLNDGEK